MGFHDVQLSNDALSYGTGGGFGFSTQVIEVPSGHEQRAARRSVPRYRYRILINDQDSDSLTAILEFHRLRGGRLNSFRFWDVFDYSTNAASTPANRNTITSTASDVVIGVGAGGATQFQLKKTYTDAGATETRTITKPIDGTVKVALDGVEQTEGVDFTVNYSTGVITFGTAVPNGVVVTAGCHFDLHVRFEQDEIRVDLEAFDNGAVPEISVIEVFDTVTSDDRYLYGGASTPVFTADMEITPQMKRFVSLAPSTDGLLAILPDITAYQGGGPHWILHNSHGSNDAVIHYAGVDLFTLAPGETAWVLVGLDGSSAKEWVCLS